MTPIGIIEDNETLRQTLQAWIDSSPDCRCVCACRTGKEALVEVPRRRPEVILMDVHLAGESGITCTTRLKAWLPELQVIILTMHKDHDLIARALKAGASGYLLKPSSRGEILRAINEVQEGGAPMTREIARSVVEFFRRPASRDGESMKLSRRENEVLELLSLALSNKQIAARLGISYGTVCVHLRRIYGKLHVRSRTEAMLKHLQGQAATPEFAAS
ncbi:MAG: response regulator transcription factor [Verrucomicrobia bacterium]|nr:response regulator transcription factor [Verrucomicrobiota bacterium]